MRLFAEVLSEELLGKLMHELGSLFYRQLNEEGAYEVVYHSANKTVRYKGKLSENMAKIVKSCGYQVSDIQIDQVSQTVKISQVTS